MFQEDERFREEEREQQFLVKISVHSCRSNQSANDLRPRIAEEPIALV